MRECVREGVVEGERVCAFERQREGVCVFERERKGERVHPGERDVVGAREPPSGVGLLDSRNHCLGEQ